MLSLLVYLPTCAAETQLWVPGEYIVKFNEDGIQDLRRRLPDPQAYSDEEIKHTLTEILGAEPISDLPLIEAQKIKATSGEELDAASAVDLLDAQYIDYISPNFIRSLGKTPNDSRYGELWGMNQANDVDIDAPEAWDLMPEGGASDVVVGVIDTGVDYRHPDLQGNLWTNDVELAGQAGVDDDANGVIDDVYGYNALAKNGNPLDDHSHGTHVSGTIGAAAENGQGVAGVAWKVKIMGLKFLSSQGYGCDSDAILAIDYALRMRNRGGHLKVLSNSWGGGGYNPALEDAIRRANDAGVLFTAAAGNSALNNDTNNFYPANYRLPNVISVAAIDSSGALASFSNFGATKVDLAAPGVNILSTTPGAAYRTMSGTSMATPHVSGVAALGYARMLQYTPAEMKSMLLSNVKPLPSLVGKMVAPGIVNAPAAAADPANAPPELQPIPNQTISSRTRIKTVPLVATDREAAHLTYEAEIVASAAESMAAALDQQQNFTAYLPQLDNLYRWSEKHLITADNRPFFLMSDGMLAEVIGNYYYIRAYVDPAYYANPLSLVNAYPVNTDRFGTLTLTDGTPPELRIETAPGFEGTFSVSVSADDGYRKDTEEFMVTVRPPDNCS